MMLTALSIETLHSPCPDDQNKVQLDFPHHEMQSGPASVLHNVNGITNGTIAFTRSTCGGGAT